MPDVSYNTRDFVSVAASFKKAVAPLFLPSMKVGTDKVIVSFNVTSVVVWTSNRDIPHSLIFVFAAL